MLLFHSRNGESTSFTEISGPLKISSASFEVWLFFFLGRTLVTTNVLSKFPMILVPPAKTGATIYIRGRRCKSLRPRNSYHTIVSPQAMEFCPGEPTRNLEILDGETGVRCSRTDFAHGLSWKCRPRYLGNTSCGLIKCVWIQEYLNLSHPKI